MSQFHQVYALEVQVKGSGLGAGQHQQIVYQPDQPVGFMLHGCQKRAAPFNIVEGAVFESFDSAVDNSQRCAQFMCDVSDEGFFGLIRLEQVGGHVVEGFAQSVQFQDIVVHRDALAEISLSHCTCSAS